MRDATPRPEATLDADSLAGSRPDDEEAARRSADPAGGPGRASRPSSGPSIGLRVPRDAYRHLMDSLPQAVGAADASGSVEYLNARWTRYTGLDKRRSRGRSWLVALHPEDVRRLARAWVKARGPGQPFTIDLRVRRADGAYRWHLLHALPARDRAGRVGRWIGSLTDIDAQKWAEGALAFLAEASAGLAPCLDEREVLSRLDRLAVPAVADRCRVEIHAGETADIRDEATGAPEAEGAAADRRSVALTARGAQARRVSRRTRTAAVPDARVTDGSHRLVAPLRAGGRVIGTLELAMDSSGRRYGPSDAALAEHLARRVAAALENARLHREATETRRRAEEVGRAKDRFLAALSHELRTPLTPVLLAASTLLEDADLRPDVRELLEMTRRNVEVEARLVDDLLDASRIASGKLHLDLRPGDAHEAVWRALEACRADVRAKGLDLEVDLGARDHRLRCDPTRLQQVVWNLVKNAAKFTPPGGHIVVRTYNAPRPSPDQEPRLVLEVEDSGAGMDAATLLRVFEPFEQGGIAEGGRLGGLGLGLAIGRAIAEAHGAHLSAWSEGLGRGSTFALDLPTIESAAPAVAGTSAARCEAPLRILLVEDNRDILKQMAWALGRRGHVVQPVDSLEAAREAAVLGNFDLVISDIELPDGCGLDLMREIAGPGGPPGIALSGYGSECDVSESRRAGFAEHLTKPVTLAALEAAIARVVVAPPAGAPSGGGRIPEEAGVAGSVTPVGREDHRCERA